MGKGEILLIQVASMTILQPSPRGFVLNTSGLQGQSLTTKPAPQGFENSSLSDDKLQKENNETNNLINTL